MGGRMLLGLFRSKEGPEVPEPWWHRLPTGALRAFFIFFIKPGIFFRGSSKCLFHRVVSDILPFLQEFRLIPDNAVIALILPEGALISPCLVDLSGAEAFAAVENFPQVKSATIIPS